MKTVRRPHVWKVPRAHLCAHAARASEHGSLIFDLQSIVRFCSPALARRLRCPPDALRGMEIRAVLPDIPFRKNTPGYNIAVCRVLFAVSRQPLRLRTSDGLSVPVRVSVQQFASDPGLLFSAEVHWRR
jgi:hypothetical protein